MIGAAVQLLLVNFPALYSVLVYAEQEVVMCERMVVKQLDENAGIYGIGDERARDKWVGEALDRNSVIRDAQNLSSFT